MTALEQKCEIQSERPVTYMSKLHRFFWLLEQKKYIVKMVSGDNFSKISLFFAVRTKYRNNPSPKTE